MKRWDKNGTVITPHKLGSIIESFQSILWNFQNLNLIFVVLLLSHLPHNFSLWNNHSLTGKAQFYLWASNEFFMASMMRKNYLYILRDVFTNKGRRCQLKKAHILQNQKKTSTRGYKLTCKGLLGPKLETSSQVLEVVGSVTTGSGLMNFSRKALGVKFKVIHVWRCSNRSDCRYMWVCLVTRKYFNKALAILGHIATAASWADRANIDLPSLLSLRLSTKRTFWFNDKCNLRKDTQ